MMMILTPDDMKALDNGTLKTKQSHPYSYHPITQFIGKLPEGQRVETSWSDRLFQQDSEKFRALQQKHFGNTSDYWEQRTSGAIEGFLRDYLDSPELVLVKVVEECNAANGYPYWVFQYYGRDTSNDA